MDRQEWLEWRKLGLGSSDFPIVMGKSRFRTPLQLYEEKISPEVKEDEDNQFIKDLGNQAETKVRSFFELIHGESFEPALCQMADYPFMRSSLDGRNMSKEDIIEIKLLGDGGKEGEKNHELKKFSRAKNEKIIPEEYFDQVQGQLLVTGAKRCFFVAYQYDHEDRFLRNQMTHDRLAVIEVLPDHEYQARLLVECIKFWECVQKRKPPVATDADFKTIKGVTKLAAKYKRAKIKADKIASELEAIEAEMKDLASKEGHPRIMIGDVKLLQISRAGNVDYSKVPQLIGVNLEQFRKKGSVYWKIGSSE